MSTNLKKLYAQQALIAGQVVPITIGSQADGLKYRCTVRTTNTTPVSILIKPVPIPALRGNAILIEATGLAFDQAHNKCTVLHGIGCIRDLDSMGAVLAGENWDDDVGDEAFTPAAVFAVATNDQPEITCTPQGSYSGVIEWVFDVAITFALL